MHDDFLHELRKEPRPEFAARLQAQLRHQATSPLEPRAPSRVRTLITLLLLGGAAFAITALAIKGVPESLLDVYRHATLRIVREVTLAPGHKTANHAPRTGAGWLAWGPSSSHGAVLRSGSAHPTAPAAAAPAAAASRTASSGGSSPVGGAPSASQVTHIEVASSWSAYLYVLPVVRRANANGVPRISVSVRDSDLWPGPVCSSGPRAPDVAYAFGPAGTVSTHPCPRTASGDPGSVVAIHIGDEAVALARSPLYGELDFTRREVFLALAKWVPDARGRTVHENPNTTWQQIDPALGPEPIEFLGPPLSSPAGRSMIELLMEEGCKTIPWIAALESSDPDRYARICRTVRTDGAYVEVSGLTPSRLLSEPNAVGIFGLSSTPGSQTIVEPALEELSVSKLDGAGPTLRSIETGAYPGSRQLYMYIDRGRTAPNVVVRLLAGGWPRPPSDTALIGPSQREIRAAFAEVRAR